MESRVNSIPIPLHAEHAWFKMEFFYSIAAQVFSISSPAPGGTFVPFLTEKNTLCQEISLYTTKGGDGHLLWRAVRFTQIRPPV